MTKTVRKIIQVQSCQQHLQSLSPHLGDELVRIIIIKQLVFFWKFVQNIQILVLCQKVQVLQSVFRFDPRVYHGITLIVNNLVKLLGRQSQKVANLVSQGLEVPNMCYRNDQFNVTHPLATYLFLGDLNPTSVTDDPFVPDSFIFTTMTFPVFDRPEDPLTE